MTARRVLAVLCVVAGLLIGFQLARYEWHPTKPLCLDRLTGRIGYDVCPGLFSRAPQTQPALVHSSTQADMIEEGDFNLEQAARALELAGNHGGDGL